MARLAIKGHATRGREVIELLEMLGGENPYAISTAVEGGIYAISNYDKRIIACFSTEQLIIFALEEFLEKFPYKVGDKVKDAIIEDYVGTIIEAQWDNYEEEMVYTVIWDNMKELNYFAKDLRPYKEKTMEEKLISKEELSLKIDTSQMEKRRIIFSADAPNETELVLGDNFEIKVEDGKTYVVKKKPQYPKTYEECCDVLGTHPIYNNPNLCICEWHPETREMHEHYSKLANLSQKDIAFMKLLICRDAYWKIAGEQMGLGKPWEYDMSKDEFSYAISYQYGHIQKNEIRHRNAIFVFPTAKMRDAFKENFDTDLEICKEFL